eukprot:scaffold3908_cov200-Skeletonema_marinoi.AAC.2
MDTGSGDDAAAAAGAVVCFERWRLLISTIGCGVALTPTTGGKGRRERFESVASTSSFSLLPCCPVPGGRGELL